MAPALAELAGDAVSIQGGSDGPGAGTGLGHGDDAGYHGSRGGRAGSPSPGCRATASPHGATTSGTSEFLPDARLWVGLVQAEA
jgi:hypothetical protein